MAYFDELKWGKPFIKRSLPPQDEENERQEESGGDVEFVAKALLEAGEVDAAEDFVKQALNKKKEEDNENNC